MRRIALIFTVLLIGLFAHAQKGKTSFIRVPNVKYATYPKSNPKLNMLDFYMPKKGSNSPVIMWIHGGAWAYGDKDDVDYKAEYFTARGYAFVAVNYREGTNVQDAADAFMWIYKNARHYSADNTKMFVLGHSEGAHVAALLSTDEQYLKKSGGSPSMIMGVILLDGAGYDIPGVLPGVDRKVEEWYRETFGNSKKEWENASPSFYIKPDKKIPPFLLASSGDNESSRMECELLANKLTEAKVVNKVFHYPKKNHMNINRDLGREEDKATEDVLRFLQELNYMAINPVR